MQASIVITYHVATVPPNWSPGPFMATTAGPPAPFAALQMVPPEQLWRRGWSPFATAGSPYNPAFITFLLNYSNVKN